MKRNLTWTFKVNLDGGQVQRWVDLLLSDQLVRDIIKRYGCRLDHWRIHRRWAGGKHEFEFWCYGEDSLKEQTLRNMLNCHIEEDETVKVLKSAGYVDAVEPPSEHAAGAANEPLPDYGVKGLHETLNRCYPKFIQRPCEILQDVIEDLCKTAGPRPTIRDGKNLSGIEQYYRGIEKEIREIWLDGAAYAYFHFFHMAFGYMPFKTLLRIEPRPTWQSVQLERFDGQVLRTDEAQCLVLCIG